MEIDIIFRLAAIGILTAIVNMVLKHVGKEELATIVTLSAVVISLLMVVTMISDLFETVRGLFNLY